MATSNERQAALHFPPGRQFTQALPRTPVRAKPAIPLARRSAVERLSRKSATPGTFAGEGKAHEQRRPFMPRSSVPLHADDISSFAKALSRQLSDAHGRTPRPPGHVELLNMLARAAGFRNFQSLRVRPPPPLPVA